MRSDKINSRPVCPNVKKNHLRWSILVCEKTSGRSVRSSFFQGTAAQLQDHIRSNFLTKGAQDYFPFSHYNIDCTCGVYFRSNFCEW